MSERKGKISTRKVWITLLSIVMIGGFIVLFVAASNNKKEGSCKGIVIEVDRMDTKIYVDTASIRKQLLTNKKWNPVGKSLQQLNIPFLEKMVDSQAWVMHTEVYLGNRDLLYLKIKQRIPVARVFTTDGKSFYLDTAGKQIPAAGKFSIKLPVFTGFSEDHKDSTLLMQIKKMGEFIKMDPFWMAQTEQIIIDATNGFEITPRVGSALIIFGDGENVAGKFEKLMTFYKEGLNNVGWGYYDTLDVRFDGQVVASRNTKDGNPVITALITHNDSDDLKEIRQEITNNKIQSDNNKETKTLSSADINR